MWATMTGSSTEEGDDRDKFLVHGDSGKSHYATNRQVAGSIPDGVTGIFQ